MWSCKYKANFKFKSIIRKKTLVYEWISDIRCRKCAWSVFAEIFISKLYVYVCVTESNSMTLDKLFDHSFVCSRGLLSYERFHRARSHTGRRPIHRYNFRCSTPTYIFSNKNRRSLNGQSSKTRRKRKIFFTFVILLMWWFSDEVKCLCIANAQVRICLCL